MYFPVQSIARDMTDDLRFSMNVRDWKQTEDELRAKMQNEERKIRFISIGRNSGAGMTKL